MWKDPNTRLTTVLRVLGNALTILGYGLLIHVNPALGSSVKVIGFSLIIPSLIQLRLYDAITIAIVFMSLDISNIVKHL